MAVHNIGITRGGPRKPLGDSQQDAGLMISEFGFMKRESSDPVGDSPRAQPRSNPQIRRIPTIGQPGGTMFERKQRSNKVTSPLSSTPSAGGDTGKPQKSPPAVVSTVEYVEGDEPMSELLRLSGGQGGQVIVEALAPESKAVVAGVRVGHALISMNGHTEFVQLPGWQVRLLLEAPITLSFQAATPAPAAPVPPPSRAEIRIRRQELVGLPSRAAVCGPEDHAVIAEEVIFKPGSASLFLRSEGQPAELGGEVQEGRNRTHVLELRRGEANRLVGRVARQARSASPPAESTTLKAGSSHSRIPASSSSNALALSPRAPPEAARLGSAVWASAATRWKSPVSTLLTCAPECSAQCLEDDAASADGGIKRETAMHFLPQALRQPGQAGNVGMLEMPEGHLSQDPWLTHDGKDPTPPPWWSPAWAQPASIDRREEKPRIAHQQSPRRSKARSPLRWIAPTWMNPLLDLVDGGEAEDGEDAGGGSSTGARNETYTMPMWRNTSRQRSASPGGLSTGLETQSLRRSRSFSPQPRAMQGDAAVMDHEMAPRGHVEEFAQPA
mmetsp:Transcript_20787/g.37865  ORF Transcript_20787/g.37865 Transcript_20787/m.37865 type:complete len:556 (-) Transcript_20787:34-1701(-)